MSAEEQDEAQKVGLELLSDEALAAVVEAAANEYHSNLRRWPRTAELALQELAERSDTDI